jgi:transposase-like protein
LSLFKRRRPPVEIILLCVRWYCKYGISYRDLAEMMQERGVSVAIMQRLVSTAKTTLPPTYLH